MSIAVVRIGSSHIGDLAGTPLDGDALVLEDERIAWVGTSEEVRPADHRLVVDAAGAGVVPGFIDSHVHVTFGDYTPRQQTVGFLESYLHGGMTRAISASEVHVPGRPTDPAGVKALAVAAERCFRSYRPGGVTVHAGSVILEPGLTEADFVELRQAGVWLAKAGFGAFPDPMGYVPVVQAARRAGLVVMCHTGGGSIPGSQRAIGAEALLAMQPNIAGHVNGGPTAMSDEDNQRVVLEGGDMALQLVQAGNLRSAIDIARLALEHHQEHRLLLASDTPTGTGMIPLALLRTMAELVSLGPLSPELALAAVTGSVARVYDLPAGRLALGAPADLLVLDAPVGSVAKDWKGALRLGDLPAVAVALTAGELRFTRSRNTPPPSRPVTVVHPA
ncbi:amidohydrolase family protein [Aciditerrimonas ferrireducens]|uniref:amidohydrolase family protein n=1 Tax=Aciditerrimonas ferrireducens TaxID=667306 RepID=UPI0020045C7B|nr:amidohydrolase family protein [Aciditerrimonas ferrireducens]MCK4177053.1 amidohydrolase family protein [Aciditerrimonas ferrireducens]